MTLLPLPPALPLQGRTGLVMGLGPVQGLAWQLARSAHGQGARLVLSCVDRATQQLMAPLAARLGLPLLVCELDQPGALQRLVAQALQRLDGGASAVDHDNDDALDLVVHATNWAPLGPLAGHRSEHAADHCVRTVRQSCHSLAELAQRCAAHMGRGGTMLSICESNAADAARHPALLGPLRAAQASTVRYLAQALAPQQIRVHALAPDPALSQDGLAMLHQVDKGLALLAAGPWRGPRPAAGPAEPGRAASAPHAANA